MEHFVQIPPNPERCLESARLLAAPAPMAATRVSVSFARVGQLRLSWGRDGEVCGRLGVGELHSGFFGGFLCWDLFLSELVV